MDSTTKLQPVATEAQPLLTPLNTLLLALLATLIYLKIRRPATPPTLPAAPKPRVFQTFTPPTLLPNAGTHPEAPYNGAVYLAIRGKVYDVTPGRNFYGPGGPYENFAGRDATRGLACGSFDEGMLTSDLEGPLDDLKGLGSEEMEALENWEQTFSAKYLVVGELVPVGGERARKVETGIGQ